MNPVVPAPPGVSPEFARFCAEVVADSLLFTSLVDSAAESFAEHAVRIGGSRGFSFAETDVRAMVQSARRWWIERNVPVLATPPLAPTEDVGEDAVESLRGWTPVHVGITASGPVVDWCRLDGIAFTEPFFDQTVTHALRHPARLLFRRRTTIAALEAFASRPAPVRRSGFVFHLSRCGSTLLAQMLAALPATRVLSEPPPIDQVLSLNLKYAGIAAAQRALWLRGIVHALAGEADRRCFVKFDSWHALELPLVREAFPEVPWIFLYRDPVEVMVSQHRQRGTQMIPGIVDPRRFGFDPAAVAAMSLDEYCARVLGRICDAVGAETGGREAARRLVNFAELPRAAWERLGVVFGEAFTDEEVVRMQHVAQFNAKTPSLPHTDDRAAKQREASEELRALAAKWVGQPYERLEAKRAGRA